MSVCVYVCVCVFFYLSIYLSITVNSSFPYPIAPRSYLSSYLFLSGFIYLLILYFH